MDKVQKPSDSECYTTSSEPFRFYLENTAFRKLDLFPSSDGGKETPILLGPLKRYNFNVCKFSQLFVKPLIT
jgi:hypothetical protein